MQRLEQVIIGVIDQSCTVALSLFPASFYGRDEAFKASPIATSAKIRFELCQRAFDLLTGNLIGLFHQVVIEERLISVEQIDEIDESERTL